MTTATAPAPRHLGHRDMFNDACDLCGAPARSSCQVECFNVLGAELLLLDTPDALDTIMCADDCGNDPGLDGFVPVRADGTPDADCSTQWAADGQLVACGRCGRVVSQVALLDALDALQVLFTLDEPPTL